MLRFNGFDGEWVKHKLNELVSYQSSSLTAKDISDDGKYALYDSNEILGKTNYNPISCGYISIVKDGSIGKIRKMPSNTMITGTMGALIPKQSNLSFLYALLQTVDLTDGSVGTTIQHIYFKDYGNNEHYIPYLSEQQQIGELFKNLDELIQSNQNKLDKLEDIKNGLLERMLPRLGNDIPELRFSGYSKNWNLKNLNDILNIFSGEFVHSKYQNEIYDFPVYNGACTYTGFYKYYNQNGRKIVMSSRGINAGFVILENNKFWAGNSAFSMNVNSEHITSFVYFYLKSKYTEIQELINNSAIPAILLNDILRFQIYIPTKEEQQKIANFFIQLDNLILLQSKKVQKLKDIKNGCLNKMFVN